MSCHIAKVGIGLLRTGVLLRASSKLQAGNVHLSLSTGETSSLVGLGPAGYFGKRDYFWKSCWYLYPIPALLGVGLQMHLHHQPGTVFGTRNNYLPFFHDHILMARWFKCLYVLCPDLHVGLVIYPLWRLHLRENRN